MYLDWSVNTRRCLPFKFLSDTFVSNTVFKKYRITAFSKSAIFASYWWISFFHGNESSGRSNFARSWKRTELKGSIEWRYCSFYAIFEIFVFPSYSCLIFRKRVTLIETWEDMLNITVVSYFFQSFKMLNHNHFYFSLYVIPIFQINRTKISIVLDNIRPFCTGFYKSSVSLR